MKKNDQLLIGLAAGAGAAALAYVLWPKSKIPNSALVSPFDKNKYLGTWHEIARLPNRIEKSLKDLTEEYVLNEDGSIKVITRAYHVEKNKPVEATGKIKFKGAETVGKLEVAYFLPVFLDYNVLDVDDDYEYALVSGNSFDYLWILSRDNGITDEYKERFLQKAEALGFKTENLEWMS